MPMNKKGYDTISSDNDRSQPLSDFLGSDEEDDELFEEFFDDSITNTNIER